MARIDTTTIEGYESMTPEQKVAALESIELPKPDYSGYVPKAALDKASSQAAEYKRQLNAKLTEDEQQKQAEAERVAALEAENTELRKKDRISTFKANYLALGYPEELAASSAEAMADGDTETVFANTKSFNEMQQKQIEANMLMGMPHPKTGTDSAINYEKQIEAAYARNDPAAVAYWTRIQQEAATAKK